MLVLLLAENVPVAGGLMAQEQAQGQSGNPANRLAKESSPYLLMHAHNPVDWYPWGPEAFEKARREGKPIFLSIGYSSCYWCHVMERETFMNEKVAELLNSKFVSIKVDREERPDIDDIYMTSLIVYNQAAGSRSGGGWPMSMFLTSAGAPIAGATYLPPEDTADGRTGFLTAAERVHDLWINQREAVDSTSDVITREVRRISSTAILAPPSELVADLLNSTARDLQSRYDRIWGGVDFSSRNPNAPRFPNVTRLMFLLHHAEQTNDSELRKIVDHSLTAMASGGIRDHLGGGFHRYSTDRQWVVPHFEKMLYDQGQLLELYAEAALKTQNRLYSEVIDELVRFIQTEMTLPGGGFCSALDAETNAIEGEYYVWSAETIRKHLSPDNADVFLKVYGFDQPQSFEHGRVIYLPKSVPQVALELQQTEAQLSERLQSMRQTLLSVRSERQRPLLDDKVLTEWNALMIQGLAKSGRLPGREADLRLASSAADFLLTTLRDSSGGLLRSWRNGTAGGKAYLDDYAALISALRALHEATGEPRWKSAALDLLKQQIELFYDPAQSAFYFTSHQHEKLFARSSSPYDSVSPSGNSLSIRNLLAFSTEPEHAEFRPIAEAMLQRFSGTLKDVPSSCCGMALALSDWLQQKSIHPVSRHSLSVQRRFLLTGLVQNPDEAAGEKPEEAPVTEQVFRPVFPDEPAQGKATANDQRVTLKVYPYFNKLQRGGKCPIAVELTIAKDWHINANPASPDFLIPTELKISSPQKIKMTRVKYPRHELLTVDGQDEPSHVYGEKVILYAMLEIDAAESAEEAELNVEVRFQACNDKTCEAPATIQKKGKMKLASEGAEIKRVHEDKFPKPDEDNSEDQK